MEQVMQEQIREMFAAGHTACSGCGQSLAAKLIFNEIGPNVIVANSTGCLEVFSTAYPYSAWRVPFIHSLFENSAAVASGVEAAMAHLGKTDTIIVSQAGDGGTADIGLQALSGMWERGQNVLSICYDNEAYMNTGIQRSGLTPFAAATSTSPVGAKWTGNWRPKKNMPEIAVAHNCAYVATATIGYYMDLIKKVRKAISIKGPKYLHVLVPCPLGWRYATELTYEISRLAVQTGLFPMFEYENGKLTATTTVSQLKPLEDYFKPQGRFAHLFKKGGEAELEKIHEYVKHNVEKYGLMK
jgi:pyruvate ferredoxin oxidoreductase beta subunit